MMDWNIPVTLTRENSSRKQFGENPPNCPTLAILQGHQLPYSHFQTAGPGLSDLDCDRV